MGVEEEGWGGWPPAPGAAPLYIPKDDHWTHFDNSVNAVSFGFVATAILISMFLVMAIFEKLLRTTSPALSPAGGISDVEAQNRIAGFNAKLAHPSPKLRLGLALALDCPRPSTLFLRLIPAKLLISTNAREVSVVMPGNNIPTFIANPAPVPCPPERVHWPSHQHRSNLHLPPTST